MTIRRVLLSCAIVAAAASCREASNVERETGYSNPTESATTVPTGTIAAPSSEVPAPTSDTTEEPTIPERVTAQETLP